MSKLAGKVAFITGAARGQGRSHAVKLAETGASLILSDSLGGVRTSPIEVSGPADLEETVRLAEKAGAQVVAQQADVRNSAELDAVAAEGLRAFGKIDIVIANAGIWSFGATWELGDDQWQEMIDINLTGVWRTVKATVPSMLARDGGGSVILISSMCGLAGFNGLAHYVAAKHGVVGLMKVLAQELGPRSIRVNSICPTNVNTPMFDNPHVRGVFVPDQENPSLESYLAAASAIHALPTAFVEPEDISNAVLYLASDDSRFVTGVPFLIDAGCLVKPA
jgi:SDR family mycofactocin-dependent oxidoreductase